MKQLTIDKPIRLVELFSGIGAQAKALENLGLNFSHYRAVDFDKYAMKSYNAIHGTNFSPSDITMIHASDLAIEYTDRYCYILTYSFPCQDLSVAGKMAGMVRGGGTRSGLLWEVERLLNEMSELPQILLMENVPQVISKKNKPDFDQWCAFLESKGYTNRWKLLNAKDYGIPQNRNRCFMVSWLGPYTYEFPPATSLKMQFQDILEQSVDEKYYIDCDESTIAALVERERERVKLYAVEAEEVSISDTHGILLLNTDRYGNALTLCAHYHKTGKTNIIGNHHLETGVIEYAEE